ncbi:MAG TPA: ComF family protein [Burkholderiales bacterium]|nr:ComF family protein [Burkholderiales bacterium]
MTQSPHYDATTALWRYEFPLDRLIVALKYGERLAFAAYFGQTMATTVVGRKVDLVVPMPLHPDRLRERGFNQAVEISRSVSRLLGIPQRTDALIRVRDTASQAELPLAERTRNMRDAFLCLSDLKDLSVALVDDVMTSGATLNEAARALKRAGAAHVENWIVARTVLKE